VDRALPALVGAPAVAPRVELLDVDGVHAEVLEAVLRVLADVIRREHLVEAAAIELDPLQILRRDLRGDVETRASMLSEQLREQLLAVPSAVGPGRVEERAAVRDRFVQRPPRLLIAVPAPPAEPPHAVADFGDRPASFRVRPVLHDSGPIRWWRGSAGSGPARGRVSAYRPGRPSLSRAH